MNDYTEQNRRSWNSVTPRHNLHKPDQLEFLRGGGSTLFDEELELLGKVSGRKLLHLQCNCGQDTISLARLGAEVVGVDIADAAIEFAGKLADECGAAARFERGEVVQWLAQAARDGRRFDAVFATYGALGWIEDLDAWMRGAASVLEPGGVLVSLEFHPLVWSFDAELGLIDDYFRAGPIHETDGVQDYVAASPGGLAREEDCAVDSAGWVNPEPAVSFQWTTAQIVQAVVDAGLRIEQIREYPYTNGWRAWANQPDLGDRRFGPISRSLPLMLGLRARRDA